MCNMTVKFKKLDPAVETPRFESGGAAGMDLRARPGFHTTLWPGEYRLIPTGLQVQLPDGIEGQIRPRSGLAAKHGVTVLNAPGTIDSDYRGEIGVVLINHDAHHTFTVDGGDRIAQIVFAWVPDIAVGEGEELDATERGEGGFGSTGTK